MLACLRCYANLKANLKSDLRHVPLSAEFPPSYPLRGRRLTCTTAACKTVESGNAVCSSGWEIPEVLRLGVLSLGVVGLGNLGGLDGTLGLIRALSFGFSFYVLLPAGILAHSLCFSSVPAQSHSKMPKALLLFFSLGPLAL